MRSGRSLRCCFRCGNSSIPYRSSKTRCLPAAEKLRLKGDTVTRRVEEKLEQVGLKGMGHKFPRS